MDEDRPLTSRDIELFEKGKEITGGNGCWKPFTPETARQASEIARRKGRERKEMLRAEYEKQVAQQMTEILDGKIMLFKELHARVSENGLDDLAKDERDLYLKLIHSFEDRFLGKPGIKIDADLTHSMYDAAKKLDEEWEA